MATGKETEEYAELCTTLAGISMELPMAHWTKESVIDTYRQFYIDNGRLPTVHDTIYEKKLPVKKHITEKFGMNLTQFYETYFSDLLQDSKEQIIQDFINQYNQMGHPTREQYDKNKRPGSVGTNKLLSISETNTWLELLKKYSLKSALQHQTQLDWKYHVTRPEYSCEDEKIARYDEIIAEIQKIVTAHDKRIARERRFEELHRQQSQQI
jgi:hypothetical protein